MNDIKEDKLHGWPTDSAIKHDGEHQPLQTEADPIGTERVYTEEYTEKNLVQGTLTDQQKEALADDVKAIAAAHGLPTEAREGEAELVPTELPSAGIDIELPHVPVIANDVFLAWMKEKHPRTQFHNTAKHHINDIMAALPAVTSQWKVHQLGIWRKMAQKLFQTTFMPYLAADDTVPFLSSKGTYVGYVFLQNAALTFNIHVVVPMGTPDAILPPYPMEGFSTAMFLLQGIPELGPKAINIGFLKKPEPNLRVMPMALISITQALTGQNIYNLSKGPLRYIGTPPKERPVNRSPREKSIVAATMLGLAAGMGKH